ncbi:MAG: hypothetical protein P8018_12400 [Acidobacteriota bacterium]
MHMKRKLIRNRFLLTALAAGLAFAFFPKRTEAIPAFARKYGVSCYTCHTIFPRLNKFGYEFKRLGYRMPPDWEGKKAPTTIRMMASHKPFSLTDTAAIFLRTDVDWSKATAQDGTSASNSSIDLAEASVLWGGAIPNSNFSYFGEYVMYEDGGSDLERARLAYTGGNVENSWFVGIGKGHLQEGFRASDTMGLTDDDTPLVFTLASPNGFSFDQSPGLVEGGYTYMAPNYNYVVGLTAKVTNGVDANGEGITSGSQYNHKDVWFDGDFLIGDNASVSLMYYKGRKPQVQNAGTPFEFTYQPQQTRYGLFGHYEFMDHLDVLAGYAHSKEDWQGLVTDPVTTFNGYSWFGELDYYIKQGLVVYGRYDKAHFDQPSMALFALQSPLGQRQYMLGVMKAVTRRGNAKVYLQYTDTKNNDIYGDFPAKTQEAKFGVDLGW